MYVFKNEEMNRRPTQTSDGRPVRRTTVRPFGPKDRAALLESCLTQHSPEAHIHSRSESS
jgi:hypothetical protein